MTTSNRSPTCGPLQEESRAEIVDRYSRGRDHSDVAIAALDIDAPGHVPWWPRPNVKLFNVLVHVLTETNRHAGHADILREQLDGAVGTEVENTALQLSGHGVLGRTTAPRSTEQPRMPSTGEPLRLRGRSHWWHSP